jgi:aminopeptidase N
MVFFTILHELVGPDQFNRIIGEYYRRYAGSGGNTAEFIALAQAEAGVDLTQLFDEWFYTTTWYELAQAGTTVEGFLERY